MSGDAARMSAYATVQQPNVKLFLRDPLVQRSEIR
jgi:hypothetical protein